MSLEGNEDLVLGWFLIALSNKALHSTGAVGVVGGLLPPITCKNAT